MARAIAVDRQGCCIETTPLRGGMTDAVANGLRAWQK
jgi:hypothetical protein